MPSRRVLKAAEAIREVVGMSILRDIQDPRVSGVTVTYVEVSGDMQQAKVHVSIMGTEAKQKLCLKGLQNAAGFFQRKIADRIQTRYTPKVLFVLDKGVKNSILVAKLLKDVLPPEDERTSCVGELEESN
ncbi:MAG: 30S ribosome-binding factor RbfA, partial [Planctomycetia bacterium]|nr:30S ribosome-binding factor RbfA [Planctomycetia bacterium]